jgi:3-isopropylmalate dehydrogenase
MMLKYGLNEPEAGDRIEQAVLRVLDQGNRTGDIMSEGMTLLGCKAMGEALIKALSEA